MKHLLVKDKKKRNLVKFFELKRLILKSLLFNLNLNLNLRENIYALFIKFNKNTSKVRLRNRCVFTNQSRFIFTKFKVSRLEFKRLIVKGKIVGVYRKSW